MPGPVASVTKICMPAIIRLRLPFMAFRAIRTPVLAGALLHVENLLAQVADGRTLKGTDSQQLIRLSCHQALARASDPRSGDVLAAAHTELQDVAGTITHTALRASFLNDIPEHREIVAAWAACETQKAA